MGACLSFTPHIYEACSTWVDHCEHLPVMEDKGVPKT